MSKRFLAAFAVAALVAPVFGDVPDGHGGRTSVYGLNSKTAVVAPAHACCDKAGVHKGGQTATSPAELKASGHLAWVTRANDPKPAMACYKQWPAQPVAYKSPAELKAVGYLATTGAAATSVTTRACCATPHCPMRPIS
jgi:hypothetical protein